MSSSQERSAEENPVGNPEEDPVGNPVENPLENPPNDKSMMLPMPPQGAPNHSHQILQAQYTQHLNLQAQIKETLSSFWEETFRQVHETNDFKANQLPLARIKKIMKADEGVRMISAEAPVLFAKACEFFIYEITLRAWVHTEENKRRTLQRADIAQAISRTDIFDFLIDMVPVEEQSFNVDGLGTDVKNPLRMGNLQGMLNEQQLGFYMMAQAHHGTQIQQNNALSTFRAGMQNPHQLAGLFENIANNSGLNLVDGRGDEEPSTADDKAAEDEGLGI